MYDELVKRLRNKGCQICPICREAADTIEELSKQNKKWEEALKTTLDFIPRWVSVEERLPGSGVPTLICGDGNVVEQGFFDDEYGYWYDWGGNRTFVHHWQPLPEPPKEEK